MESESYKRDYEDYAKAKAETYSVLKFHARSPYGFRNSLREEMGIRSILHLNLPDGSSILDMGCASGHTSILFAQRLPKFTVVGIDIADSFVDQAKSSGHGISNLNFKVWDASSGQWDEARFDVVYAAEIIEHVEDLTGFLNSIKMLMAPGGRAIITTPNLNSDGTVWGRLMRRLAIRSFVPATRFDSSSVAQHGDQHVREFDYRTFSSTLESNGFKLIDLKGLVVIDIPANDILMNKLLHFIKFRTTLMTIEFSIMERLNWFSLRFGRQLYAVVMEG